MGWQLEYDILATDQPVPVNPHPRAGNNVPIVPDLGLGAIFHVARTFFCGLVARHNAVVAARDVQSQVIALYRDGCIAFRIRNFQFAFGPES